MPNPLPSTDRIVGPEQRHPEPAGSAHAAPLPSLFLAAPFCALWAQEDPFVAVERLQGEVCRALEGRRTLRCEIAGRGYFVKIHRGVGWREIFKNLLSLRLPVLGARNEYAALGALHAAGVPTMQAVAYGNRGANPATRHSFIITEALTPTVSLDAALCAPGTSFSPTQRRALVARVADMVRRMHAAGINHRDLYLCHFLLHLDAPAQAPRLSLIDLHRAQWRAHVPRRWRDKDLAALYFSALDCGVSRHEQLRFLRAYFARPLRQIFVQETRLLRHLGAEGKRLQARYARKFAAPGAGAA